MTSPGYLYLVRLMAATIWVVPGRVIITCLPLWRSWGIQALIPRPLCEQSVMTRRLSGQCGLGTVPKGFLKVWNGRSAGRGPTMAPNLSSVSR